MPAPQKTGLQTRESLEQPAQFRCPDCESIIYSRKSKLCGVCGEPLPAELLFSPAEVQRIENLLEYERLRHRRWMVRSVARMASTCIA